MNIKSMTDSELKDANQKLIDMMMFRETQLTKKKKRHIGIDFTNTNPAYEDLKDQIEKEIKDRGL